MTDVAYMTHIAAMPCLICKAPPPSHPHHQPKRGHGSISKKTTDYRTVPLCANHHTGGGTEAQPGSFHGMSWPFWDMYGVDIEAVIANLNIMYTFVNPV